MDQLLVFSRQEAWSIAVILLTIGPTAVLRAILAFKTHVLIWNCFLRIVEYLIVFNAVLLIFNHLCEKSVLVVFLATLISYPIATVMWHKASVKQKRWWRGATVLLGSVLLIIYSVQIYFEISFYMAAMLLWRKVVVKLFIAIKARSVAFALWLVKMMGLLRGVIVRFFTTMTWVTAQRLLTMSSVKVVIRWCKKLVIFLVMFQVVANRTRRLFVNEKTKQVKDKVAQKKSQITKWYNGLKFRWKLLLCISVIPCIFFIGDAWQFFYTFLPRGFVVQFLKGVSWLLKKIGLQKLIDKTTNLCIETVSGCLCEEKREKWRLYRKWRLPRVVIITDRWIMVVNRPARDKAREMRMRAILNFKKVKEKVECAREAVRKNVFKKKNQSPIIVDITSNKRVNE